MNKKLYIAAIIACISISTTAASAFADIETLAPRLSITEEYTDNLYLTETDTHEEFTTIISPGFDYSYNERDGGMDVSYTAGYVIYKETDEDERWRHNATIRIWKNPSKHTQIDVRNAFIRTDESRSIDPLQDQEDPPLVPEDTTRRTGRNEYITNTATATLTHQFGEQNSFDLIGLFSLRNELDPAYNNDNERYSPASTLDYWLSPQLGFNMSTTYTRGIFDDSSDFDDWQNLLTLRRSFTRHLQIYTSGEYTLRRFDEVSSTDYDLYAASAGINYDIEDSISLTLGGGYFFQDMKEAASNNEDFFFDAAIDKSWTYPRGSASLTGSAGLDRSEFGTENLGLERFYSLSASTGYRLTRRLETGANASFRFSDYLNTPDNREEARGRAGCYLSYTPKPWLTINTSYSFNLLRSNLEGVDYDENVVLLTISFSPQGTRYQ